MALRQCLEAIPIARRLNFSHSIFCKPGWWGARRSRYCKLHNFRKTAGVGTGERVMRCVLVWLATALGAVAQLCCGAEVAFAQGDAAAHVLFFTGTDIWRNGLFSHAGFLWSYRGLNE